MLVVRGYKTEDYEGAVSLYKREGLYGGQFDEDRDSRERLDRKISDDPESILVCEQAGKIVGTVSLLEDARTAWLLRFASETGEATALLYKKAAEILKARGHKQVLVYAPPGQAFENKFAALGFTKGGNYTCFYTGIE